MSVNNITKLVENLEVSVRSLVMWFRNNYIKGTTTKCQVLLSTNKKVSTKVDSAETENSQPEKLLRVTSDNQLSFEKHINNICDRAKAKLSALSWFASLINFNQKMLMNASL